MRAALVCVAVLGLVGACTYDVQVDHAVENLALTYAPCASDAGARDATPDGK